MLTPNAPSRWSTMPDQTDSTTSKSVEQAMHEGSDSLTQIDMVLRLADLSRRCVDILLGLASLAPGKRRGDGGEVLRQQNAIRDGPLRRVLAPNPGRQQRG